MPAVVRLGFIAIHGRMVAKNCTTIEMFEKSRISPWPYDHGWRRNFQEVFGRGCAAACQPETHAALM
jgi:hypothetical protein